MNQGASQNLSGFWQGFLIGLLASTILWFMFMTVVARLLG